MSSASKPSRIEAGDSSTPTGYFRGWTLPLLAILWLVVTTPGTWKAWSGVGMLSLAYGASMLNRRSQRPDSDSIDASSQEFTRQAANVSPTSSSTVDLSPAFSLSQSLVVSSVCSSLMSVGLFCCQDFFPKNVWLPSIEQASQFTAVAGLMSWIVLLCGMCTEKVSWCRQNRGKLFALGGIAIGSMAYALDEFLLVDYPRTLYSQTASLRTIGIHPLTADGANPTWLGYVAFFCGLMFLRRWWRDMSPQRSQSLSLWRLASAPFVAWILTLALPFPQWHAIALASVVSATVQLASPLSLRLPRRSNQWAYTSHGQN